MKPLVIVAHPNLTQSKVHKRWLQELQNHPEITVHNLFATYPNWIIDVAKEQQLLNEHDRIVLQFPFYWYSCPPLLKKWEDDILTYGWAYGSKGNALYGKELMLAVSTGGPQEAYQAGGMNNYAMSELLKPFQATSNLIGTRYLPAFIFHGALQATETQVAQAAVEYLQRIFAN